MSLQVPNSKGVRRRNPATSKIRLAIEQLKQLRWMLDHLRHASDPSIHTYNRPVISYNCAAPSRCHVAGWGWQTKSFPGLHRQTAHRIIRFGSAEADAPNSHSPHLCSGDEVSHLRPSACGGCRQGRQGTATRGAKPERLCSRGKPGMQP